MEKRILKPGKGLYSPNPQASVVVDIRGKWCTADGEEGLFDSREYQKITIDEASDALSQVLEDVICSMKEGEECSLEIKMDDTLAMSSLLNNVPSGSTIVYNIHLVSFENVINSWNLSDSDRHTIILWHKSNGTELFKANNIYGAALHYSKAIKYIIAVDKSLSEDRLMESQALLEKVDVLVLKKPILLNLAACQLKLQQYSNVVHNCTCVLQEGLNVKALYRRGQAFAGQSDFENAKKDFLKAKEVEPHNMAVIKQLREIEQRIQQQTRKYRESFRGMFS